MWSPLVLKKGEAPGVWHAPHAFLMLLFVAALALGHVREAHGQGIVVKEKTLPPAGVDSIKIKMVETYDVEGVGKDTVELTGTLVTRRGAPLLGTGATGQAWETSTVVAEFQRLELKGKSRVFGPVTVTLDKGHPAFAAVTAGKCKAALSVQVEMPDHRLTLRTATAVQLQSTVTRVPPIGNDTTKSVGTTKLVDKDGKSHGTITKAVVTWRELASQKQFDKP